MTFGGGHTQSDALVYIPKDKIAIMGDLVLSKHDPVLMYANPQQWLEILDKVEQLNIETIVPGHGEVCSLTELHEVKAYITDLLEIVTAAVQSNQSLEMRYLCQQPTSIGLLPRILNRICKPFRNGSLNVVKTDPDLQGYCPRYVYSFLRSRHFRRLYFLVMMQCNINCFFTPNRRDRFI
ncbi:MULTISPECIES: MBL fold metallo-hydrolase [unclassified Paenibacillus]|uniref:MBL fold metallo-hydrolase n=1 Tax=unclassified Paenibacillus TaxID=185978 RepID=UPI001EF009AE|nr:MULTISPECIES: MBL fold metallo-hydrolase [unclassified Paenibacillus]